MENSFSVKNLDPTAQEYHPRAVVFPHAPPPPPPPLIYPYTLPLMPYNTDQPPPAATSTLWYSPYTSPYVNVPPSPSPSSSSSAVYPPSPPPSVAPTRTLILSLVPSEASETVIRRDLEIFGEVRGVQMGKIREGIVSVHFYDLRHATKALKEIREQHMQQQSRLRKHYEESMSVGKNPEAGSLPLPPSDASGLVAGRAVWAQFGIPAFNAVPGGNNQGTIVVFNLDPDMPTFSLKRIFEAFGAVKELRETPMKKQQKFVEFYDVRDAARALNEMNGKEINGKPVVIEFSRPGGFSRKFFNASNSFSRNYKYSPLPSPPPPPPLPYRKASQHGVSNWSVRSYGSSSGKSSTSSSRENPRNESCSMSSLSLNDFGEERDSSRRHARKKDSYNDLNAKQHGKNRSWKGKQVRKSDGRYLIYEDAISESNCRDTRTTVMVKNIPNKYSQQLLLSMLDSHCIHSNEQIAQSGDQQQPLSSYDFVYLPIDFTNKCNVGYGFVNMTSPEATLRLYKAFHHQQWEVFNSRKICEVTYARVQGLEALKEHFKNSKFPCEMENYLPVVFSPPRDGRTLTEPTPIVAHRQPQQQGMPITIGGEDSKSSDDETKGHDIVENGVHYVDDDSEQGPRHEAASSSSGGNQNDGNGIDNDDKGYGSAVGED